MSRRNCLLHGLHLLYLRHSNRRLAPDPERGVLLLEVALLVGSLPPDVEEVSVAGSRLIEYKLLEEAIFGHVHADDLRHQAALLVGVGLRTVHDPDILQDKIVTVRRFRRLDYLLNDEAAFVSLDELEEPLAARLVDERNTFDLYDAVASPRTFLPRIEHWVLMTGGVRSIDEGVGGRITVELLKELANAQIEEFRAVHAPIWPVLLSFVVLLSVRVIGLMSLDLIIRLIQCLLEVTSLLGLLSEADVFGGNCLAGTLALVWNWRVDECLKKLSAGVLPRRNGELGAPLDLHLTRVHLAVNVREGVETRAAVHLDV